MQSIIIKDKILRNYLKKTETKNLVFKNIVANSNIFNLLRWNAIENLKILNSNKSKSKIVTKCRETINKKKFNKFSYYSRNVFLKKARFGLIHGLQKAAW